MKSDSLGHIPVFSSAPGPSRALDWALSSPVPSPGLSVAPTGPGQNAVSIATLEPFNCQSRDRRRTKEDKWLMTDWQRPRHLQS